LTRIVAKIEAVLQNEKQLGYAHTRAHF